MSVLAANETMAKCSPMLRLGWWGGVGFLAQWLACVLLFPIYKQEPLGYAPVAVGIAFGIAVLSPRVRTALNRAILSPSTARFLTAITAGAVMLRLIAVAWFPIEPVVDDGVFHAYAKGLLEKGEYGGAEHRAFFPPGMTFLLTAAYWLTVPHPLSGKIVNVLFGTSLLLISYDLCRRVVDQVAARWAALLVATMPTLIFLGATLQYETVLLCIMLAVSDLVLISATTTSNKVGGLSASGIGILLGFGALVKPICLLMPPLLLVSWWVLAQRGRAVAYTMVATLFLAAVVAPWTWRNYRVLGEFVPISTNGGVVLYAANNPESQGMWMPVQPLPGETDEVARDRMRTRAALRWTWENPAKWFELAIAKCTYVWGTSSTIMSLISYDRMPVVQEKGCKALINVFWVSMLLFVARGILSTPLWQRRAFVLPALILFYVWGLHLFFEANSRHHVPALGAIIIAAAAGLGCDKMCKLPRRETFGANSFDAVIFADVIEQPEHAKTCNSL